MLWTLWRASGSAGGNGSEHLVVVALVVTVISDFLAFLMANEAMGWFSLFLALDFEGAWNYAC